MGTALILPAVIADMSHEKHSDNIFCQLGEGPAVASVFPLLGLAESKSRYK